MKRIILAIALATCGNLAFAADTTKVISMRELAELTQIEPVVLRALFNPSAATGRYPMNYHRALQAFNSASARLSIQGIALEMRSDGLLAMRSPDAGDGLVLLHVID